MTFKDQDVVDAFAQSLSDLLWSAQEFSDMTQSWVTITTPMFRNVNGPCTIKFTPNLKPVVPVKKEK